MQAFQDDNVTWKTLLKPNIQSFIRDHEDADVRDLALKKAPDADWDYPLILDQIKARQKARGKVSEWLDTPGVIFPASDVLEQASSAVTAGYKANIVHPHPPSQGGGGRIGSFVDLTGGCGVDAWAVTANFQRGTVIDADAQNAAILAHNFEVLGCASVEVAQARAEDFVDTMTPVDLVMIDPQRRDGSRKGKYRLEDCSPNVFDLLPVLKNKTKQIVLKTSPMLDIDQTVLALGCVQHVHVLEWQGECKEVLYVLEPSYHSENPQITAMRLDDHKNMAFTREQEAQADVSFSEPLQYLYEPGPAFMKAGGFKVLCAEYGVSKLHPHTHLYTANRFIDDFPGRGFAILGVYPVQAKALPFRQANLAVRNFPSDVAALKQKLKIKDGGEDYAFVCTIKDDEYRVIHGRKVAA